jgi:subtilisin family serine protease
MNYRYFVHPLFLTMLCVCVVLITTAESTWQQATAQGIAQPINPMLIQQVSLLTNAGNSNDSVPVIILLKQTTKERASDSSASIDANRLSVARAQQSFVQRHKTAFQQFSGTTTVIPLVFGRLQRKNIQSLLSNTSIASIHEDMMLKPSLYESNTLIGSSTVNTLGYDGTGTSVAVLDTGVSSTHPFLAGKVVDEACFSTHYPPSGLVSLCPGNYLSSTAVGSGEPCDVSALPSCSHGTHVAGIVAGNMLTSPFGESISGVAPGANVISIQVFTQQDISINPSGCGTGATSDCIFAFDSDLIKALDWVYLNRTTPTWGTLSAINMSLGGGISATFCNSSALKLYIDVLRTAGIATIISSGNDSSTNGVSSPACISSAIAVGASTTEKASLSLYNPQTGDQIAYFSNAPLPANNVPNSSGDRLLDFVAPGYTIYSSVIDPIDSYDWYPGTSMAAPQVAGAWAILKGIDSSASVPQILAWLTNSAVLLSDSRGPVSFSIPRISLPDSVADAVGGVVFTDTPTATITKSPTPTFTRSRTSTRTRTPSRTRTPTRTRTFTKTRTRTPWFHTRTPFWIPTKKPTNTPSY